MVKDKIKSILDSSLNIKRSLKLSPETVDLEAINVFAGDTDLFDDATLVVIKRTGT